MSIQNNTAVDVYQNFVLPTALDSDFQVRILPTIWKAYS